MEKFKKVFKTPSPVIGALHFPPLLGYPGFPGIDVCVEKALREVTVLEEGGVDSIIIENNYDLPHREFLLPETVAAMTFLACEVSRNVTVPLGVSVLWNDYKTAFAIAKLVEARFVRVPVFVDTVSTSYGEIHANPSEVTAFRDAIDAKEVLLFADVHVKHAAMLKPRALVESATEALNKGADGLIITGKWTGDAPNIDKLKQARGVCADKYPILIGSGATTDNVKSLMEYADGVIVGTSLKTGEVRSKDIETNLKPWEETIDLQKVSDFVHAKN